MKYAVSTLLIFSISTLFICLLSAQNNVSINNTGASPHASAMLDVQSQSKGLLVPRMTTEDRNFIPSPATGLIVYDTEYNSFFFYAGSAWIEVVGGFTSLISDADEDTKIDVEESHDEDTIKFMVGGVNMAKMDGKTFHLESPGNSLFIGNDAGTNDDGTNNSNLFVGPEAGKSNLSGTGNTFIGKSAGHDNASGHANTMIGEEAGYANTTGEDNVFIGRSAGLYNEDGGKNTFIGNYSGWSNTSGEFNIAIGDEALFSNNVGINNIAIGKAALLTNMDGEENVAIGQWSLSQSSSADNNVAVGYYALSNNTSGEHNTAVGHQAMYLNQSGDNNAAVGRNALYNNTIGYSNTAFGVSSLQNNNDGYFNAGFGTSALFKNISGLRNTAMGTGTQHENTSGNDNTSLGYFANGNNQTGSNNTILGSEAGAGTGLHNKSGNVFLGYKAGYEEGGDNKLYIENSSSTAPLIYGDFTNGSEVVGINGFLGVGTQSPAFPLTVSEDGVDSMQTVVGILRSPVSHRPILLFSENTTNTLSTGMSIEYNGAAGTGDNNEMYINKIGGDQLFTFENSGDFGIGTTNPSTRIQILGGSDSGPGGGGYITLGSDDGLNMSFDNNEIMARNNGEVANMYLQANGGMLGIGAVTFDSKVNIRSDVGEHPLRARVGTSTKFLVHNNGGVAIGANTTPPANGLKVEGDILLDGDDITSTQTLRLNSSTKIELIVGSNTITIDPVTGITISSNDDIVFESDNDIIFNADNNITLNADNDISFDAISDILMDANLTVDLSASSNFLISGSVIDLVSDTELELNAGTIMDINSSGNIDINGSSTVDLDGSQVRLETEGNSFAGAARIGSNVSNPPCVTGCTGTVTSGSATVLIGY